MWARQQVGYLMNQDLAGVQGGTTNDEIRQAIIDLGLEYRIMTQFTSFVAVEELVVTEGGETRTIPVPVEVKSDAAKASFKDGLLEVTLPKVEPEKKAESVKIQPE